jgi:protein involved in polysaccharide export with SLBB domain
MLLNKLRNVIGALVAIGIVASGTVLLAQPRGPTSQVRARASFTPKPSAKDSSTKRKPAPYVVEPPDLLIVEVLEALPGRPITGERLVRPDGTISLGFYGDVDVAGLTVIQVKEKVIDHLRNFLSDEQLGLLQEDPDHPGLEPPKLIPLAPKESSTVFVDVGSYNSKFFYVDGDVNSPGRFPVTGQDRVRDALHFAGGVRRSNSGGGVTPSAAREKIRLIRKRPNDVSPEVIEIDYQRLIFDADSSLNYEMQPGDRIVVSRDPNAQPSFASPPSSPGTPSSTVVLELRAIEERMWTVERSVDRMIAKELDARLDGLERTLKDILEQLRELNQKKTE